MSFSWLQCTKWSH